MNIRSMPIDVGRFTFSGVPDEELFEALRAEGVDCWWNLALELGHLVPSMEQVAREVLWAQIPDYSAPVDVVLFMSQLDRVCEILRAGGRVHVSCYGGRGRTGLALACVRVRLLDDAPEDALRLAHDVSGGPEVEEQRAFVRGFASES